MVDEENAFAGNEWEAECWPERAVIILSYGGAARGRYRFMMRDSLHIYDPEYCCLTPFCESSVSWRGSDQAALTQTFKSFASSIFRKNSGFSRPQAIVYLLLGSRSLFRDRLQNTN